MKSAVKKHSVVIHGHKTSVSIEDEFWDALVKLADDSMFTIGQMVRMIDKERQGAAANYNLSSAIRVFLFKRALASRR